MILKLREQQRLVTFHTSGDFLPDVFQKSGKFLLSVPYKKEGFNKLETKMKSENESKPKKCEILHSF